MDVPILADPAILVFKFVPLFGTPVVVTFAWSRAQRVGPAAWRAWALRLGLVAASINALLSYSAFAYSLISDGAPFNSPIQHVLEEIAVALIFAALAGAIVGKGQGRILTAAAAVMGFLLWVPVAFL
jgi:hypothetical protein